MRKISETLVRGVAVAAVLALAALPAGAAGFSIFEQGSKAMGMSQAVTAQGDDPSTIFFNAGGLAFLDQRQFQAGVTLISLGNSSFEGLAPFPGPDVIGNQKNQIVTPVHAYWVEPINDHLSFGLGLTSPFGLVTEWEHPSEWAGRFVSEKAELLSWDLNPEIGWQVSERLGIGFGVSARFSEVELKRSAATINPFTQMPVDVARVKLNSDLDTAYGWNIGLLHRVTDRISWGLSYRSAVKTDYNGDARLTQVPTGNPTLDAIIAGTYSFDADLPIKTSIETPDMASLGVAVLLTPRVLFEADFNWAGWSTFDALAIDFQSPNDALDSTIVTDWKDVNNYRFGVRWDTAGGGQWRFGGYVDESPQPDPSVGPLLPDADRTGWSVGWGTDLGAITLDLAALYVDFDTRTTTTNNDGFQGTYRTSTLLLGGTIGW